MGGAEKWMNDTAKMVDKKEKTILISVNPSIANIYGQIVLKRKYDRRAKNSDIHNHTSLTLESFIPFTKRWNDARKEFSNARLIYARYEILELSIILYFLGFKGLKKTIAGIHSPFIYGDPISFLNNFHNAVYKSNINLNFLKKMKKVHVLNIRDENYFKKNNLKNVVYVPNGIDAPKNTINKMKTDKKTLYVISVGELSKRKGTDILIEIIKNAPSSIQFTIAGDGYMKKDIIELVKNSSNVKYVGHVKKYELEKLYENSDVLIIPSRAESMSLTVLEALSHGLTIVNSNYIRMNLDNNIEYSNKNSNEYLNSLSQISKIKLKNKLDKTMIANYFNRNYTKEHIYPILNTKLFNT